MKILIRAMDTNGKPLPDSRILRGFDSLEIVTIMHVQTPFTGSKPLPEYLADVLKKVEGESSKPLPQEPQAAASDFLSRLASRGLVEFLPEEPGTAYPPRFCQIMEVIRRSGLTNMLDRKVVAQIARELGFDEIADWINKHRREYAEFVLDGRIRFLNDPDDEAKGDPPCVDK